MKWLAAASCLFALVVGAADTNELDVARQALRDGLWEVSRAHAAKAKDNSALPIVLESFARERKWGEVLRVTESRATKSEVASYYRALALFESGRIDEAQNELNGCKFADDELRKLASGLRARMLLKSGNGVQATELLQMVDFDEADDSSRMAAADMLDLSGDRKAAERLWRSVVASSNSDERAFAVAAANLGDPELLRTAYSRAKSAANRRFVGLRLGRELLASDATFDEGARLIRAISKDAPDTEGAQAAFLALADALLNRKQLQESADAWRDALEIWPECARLFRVQDGRAWSLRGLRRYEEALVALNRAEECASNDVDRATAILEQGDVLSETNCGAEALAKYRLVLAKYPQTPAGERLKVIVRSRELEAHGRELYRDYRFAEAQKTFAEMASIDPSRKSRAEYLDVLCLYGQGRDLEASEKARKIAGGSGDPLIRADAMLWLAKFTYNRRQWGESSRLFAAYAELRPDSPHAPSALIWSARAAFAENDYNLVIQTITKLDERYPESAERIRAFLLQGEALIELARFDEAVLVLERALLEDSASDDSRLRAQILKADALFAMGADNAARYSEALDSYRQLMRGESPDPSVALTLAFKIGKALEKLRRLNEAIDQYYTNVVLAYRNGRIRGVRYDDEAKAVFSRAAFILVDEYESRGQDYQALHVLDLVVNSDVPAAEAAAQRIQRIQSKGNFL